MCSRSIYDFFVTLTQEPLWQTVPRLILGHNFLICGWILEPDTSKCSACQMLHLRCIIRMLSLISELKKPKKLKVLVWQAKFESGIILFWKLNMSPAKLHYFSLAHPTGDGTNLRSSPHQMEAFVTSFRWSTSCPGQCLPRAKLDTCSR